MTNPFIYIARHAWAHDYGDERWPDDSQRPLEEAGGERYIRVIKALTERGFEPEIIATSPYTRCRETADIIARHTRHKPEVVELPALEPQSDFEKLIDWTRKQQLQQVCWVGHAPDVGFLTAALIGARRANIRFAKGGVAAVRVYEDFGPDCGELYWHVTAKALGL